MYFPRYVPMEQYKRELFVSRISAGYLRYKLNNEVYQIHGPSLDDMYEAQEIYNETYNRAVEMSMVSHEETVDMLINRGMWCEEDNNQLEKVLPAHIELFKLDIYRQFSNEKERETIRKYLNCASEAIADLFSKKHMFDYMTAHGVATFARWQFLVEASTRYKGQKLDWASSDCNIMKVMDHINKNLISEATIRELARTEPFKTIWITGKKNGGTIFSLPGCSLTDEQKRLISWASLYDNVLERNDCPPEEIMYDDDAFDGWMIDKSREAKHEKEVANTQKKINKSAANAPEVFFVASDNDPNALFSKSEIGKIYNLNDPTSKNIINQRLNMISERGDVKESEFPDVQREMSIARNKAAINAMRR